MTAAPDRWRSSRVDRTVRRLRPFGLASVWAGLVASIGLAGMALLACGSPTQAAQTTRGPRRPPPRPGESITHTQMCSCLVCEPTSCCHELEADAPEVQKDCADGYDFSKCEMAVSSCDSNCFQHRWRTRVEVGCAESRPDRCCHDQSL